MARIRSIKPEFWTDGKTQEMSDSCALFFIALWNFCDDEGKIKNDATEIKARMGGRWRSDKIRTYIRLLLECGRLRVSVCSEWLQTTNWVHQRIDRPVQPKIKASDIKWKTQCDSSSGTGVGHEQSLQGSDRSGSDRIGKDPKVARGSQPVAAQPSLLAPPVVVPKADTKPTWDAYRTAFGARYHVDPVRNARVNSQMASFVRLVGAEDAPAIVEFYVRHNKTYYVQSMHSVGALVRDAEALRNQWMSGKKITDTEARQMDRRQTTYNSFAPLLAEAEAREKGTT